MNDLIYGKRRQGKSTLALALAVARHSRVVIWDPNDQYPLFQSVEVARIANLGVAPQGGYLVVRVGPTNTDVLEERFAEFGQALDGEHDLSIIVDEAHMLQRLNWVHPDLDRLNRRSPGDVCTIQTTHRIVNAGPDSRYFADNVFFFYADLSRELKTLGEHYGEKLASIVPTLGPHEVVRYYRLVGGRAMIEVWRDSSIWYINLENKNHA